jgi:hypothetical protein
MIRLLTGILINLFLKHHTHINNTLPMDATAIVLK